MKTFDNIKHTIKIKEIMNKKMENNGWGDYGSIQFEPLKDFTKKIDTVHALNLSIDIDWDWKFFAILPAINLNFHEGFVFEFEWMFLGIYIFKRTED